MPTAVIMPKLGLTMVEGQIIEWRKNEGDRVEKGEILFVIETEKVTYEVEAPESGLLAKVLVPAGETRPIGETLAYIVQPGETLAETPVKAPPPRSAAQVQPSPEPAVVPAGPESGGPSRESAEKIKISPVAKKIAEEHGLDITLVKGTGPQGRIVKEDVLRAVEEAQKPVAAPPAQAAEAGPPRSRLVKPGGMRRTIARRMSESFQTPHFWMSKSAFAVRLKEARERLLPAVERDTGQRLTYTDLIVKAVARALESFPGVNAYWTAEGIEMLEEINVGLATSVPDGLIVPVIRQANLKSLAEITKIRSDLVTRGRDGKLGLDELAGSTITITNLGMAGIEYGYPIINPPEASIIALGAIKERPFVVDGQVAPLLSLNITLGIDHRILDGFIAAQFLNRVVELIEDPLLLL